MPPYFDAPDGPVFTLEDLKNCGWETAVAESEGESCSSKWSALTKSAEEAESQGRIQESKALALLSHLCSMMLKPENRNEPFQPVAVFTDGRSAIPDDFTLPEIDLLEQFVNNVDDRWLRARIADLLWLRRSPRDPKFALEAVDAYKSITIDGDAWVDPALDCWRRAISLSMMLREGAGDRVSEIEENLLALFFSSTAEQRFFALKLAEVMEEYNLGSANVVPVSEQLRSIAEDLQAEGHHNSARSYFANASVWFRRAGDEIESLRMTVAEAETWISEAEFSLSSASPSNILASTFYEKAIQTYRNIPHAYREQHQVIQRISEIKRRLSEAGLLSLEEMSTIESPTIDLTPFIEDALERVKGKTTQEAIRGLSNLFRVRASELRKAAVESLTETPLRALISRTLMTHDGRATARTPGFMGQPTSEGNETAIEAEMIQFHYEPLVNIAVMGYILPALNAISLEHRVREGDLIQLARLSPIVPPDRDRLYGKALYHGYNGDFASALHLLVPQIEHMVRHHLKMNQVTTTTLDREGIETETGLSALVDLPEVKEIFGEDLTFELKALFCSPYGANLRNEVAHGLVEEAKCFSTHSVYAWWLGLKLAFNTLWNSAHQANDSTEDQYCDDNEPNS